MIILTLIDSNRYLQSMKKSDDSLQSCSYLVFHNDGLHYNGAGVPFDILAIFLYPRLIN